MAVYMEARLACLVRKFLHINTHKWASLAAKMEVQRCCCKLFLKTVKTTKLSWQAVKQDKIFSYKHKTNSCRLRYVYTLRLSATIHTLAYAIE